MEAKQGHFFVLLSESRWRAAGAGAAYPPAVLARVSISPVGSSSSSLGSCWNPPQCSLLEPPSVLPASPGADELCDEGKQRSRQCKRKGGDSDTGSSQSHGLQLMLADPLLSYIPGSCLSAFPDCLPDEHQRSC